MKRATGSDVYRVRDRAQLRALASPVRQQVLQALGAIEPCTAKELAAHLGRKPVSLYYHLRALQEVGLVVEQERRPTARRSEAVYRAVAKKLRVEAEKPRGATLQSLKKLGGGILRRALRLHDAALDAGEVGGGDDRRHVLGQKTVRLSPAGRRRVNRKIRELLDLIDEEHGRGRGEFHTLTVHLAPDDRGN